MSPNTFVYCKPVRDSITFWNDLWSNQSSWSNWSSSCLSCKKSMPQSVIWNPFVFHCVFPWQLVQQTIKLSPELKWFTLRMHRTISVSSFKCTETSLKINSQEMHWDPLILRWYLYIKYFSMKAYDILRGVLKLPSTRTLRDYTYWTEAKPGTKLWFITLIHHCRCYTMLICKHNIHRMSAGCQQALDAVFRNWQGKGKGQVHM